MSIILGIDPGTTDTGYAFLQKEGSKVTILDYGTLKTTPKIPLEDKLLELADDIEHLIKLHKPTIAGIEKIFFTKNAKTAIDVAHARGVIIHALAKSGTQIVEYSPPEIKKAICGNGRADKKQVQNALRMIFGMKSNPPQDDAADALAVAYITSLHSLKP